MYLGIHLKKNSKTKTGKKKERKKERRKKKWAGLEPRTYGSLRTSPDHYTTKARDVLSAKGFLFNAFSTENPPANAVKDDRAA